MRSISDLYGLPGWHRVEHDPKHRRTLLDTLAAHRKTLLATLVVVPVLLGATPAPAAPAAPAQAKVEVVMIEGVQVDLARPLPGGVGQYGHPHGGNVLRD